MSELTPVTRKEQFYDRILQAAESGGGGGGGSTLIEKSISANGVYNATEDSADGYSKVTVDVPNTYTAQDEGKVVDNGALVAQTTHAEITENGTYDITTNNSVSVNVSGGGIEFSNDPSSFKLLTNIRNLNITIPNGCTSIDDSAFIGCIGLLSVAIPNTVTLIGNSAFKNCTNITEINIPNSVTSIGSSAFNNCSNLTSINIPDNITVISQAAFYQCSKITSIEIPQNVNHIYEWVFAYCSSLQSIKFYPSIPPTISSNVWTGVPTTCIIYVPSGTLSAYTSTAKMPDPNTYTYVEY